MRPHWASYIIPAPGSKRWHITTSTAEAAPHCDVILVTVPTPVTEDLKPDLSFVRSAGIDVFSSILPGSRTVVVLESTVMLMSSMTCDSDTHDSDAHVSDAQ